MCLKTGLREPGKSEKLKILRAEKRHEGKNEDD
jgi:hypothetical protein